MLETAKHDWKSWKPRTHHLICPFCILLCEKLAKNLSTLSLLTPCAFLWLGVDTLGRARDPIKAKPTGLTARHGWPGRKISG